MPKEAREPILHGRNARISEDFQGEGRGRKADDFKMNDQKQLFDCFFQFVERSKNN